MAGGSVTALAGATLSVSGVVEVRILALDLLMASDTTVVGNGRDGGEGERGLLGDVYPEFIESDELVRQPSGDSALDVAVDTAHVGVRALTPGLVVRTHLMAGGITECRLVGRQGSSHRGSGKYEQSR